ADRLPLFRSKFTRGIAGRSHLCPVCRINCGRQIDTIELRRTHRGYSRFAREDSRLFCQPPLREFAAHRSIHLVRTSIQEAAGRCSAADCSEVLIICCVARAPVLLCCSERRLAQVGKPRPLKTLLQSRADSVDCSSAIVQTTG